MFNFLPTDEFLMYLRKSRSDIEAEAHGAGDTLKRHEAMLAETAKRLNIIVPERNIYREIVTGETIADRVEMQKVLRRVQDGGVRGVLVVEVERLSRGDTIDQGIVAQTFKYSGTLIITPVKTYDPNNEYDEEYFEFGLFQSRQEYKTTTRRLQNGRRMSAYEGKWIGNVAPYGYSRRKLSGEKGWTLEINEEEAEAVRLIYDLYVSQGRGPVFIATELDRLGYKPRHSKNWSVATLRTLISNPVYAGVIAHGRRKQTKSIRDGEVVKARPNNKDYEKFRGRHPALVDEVTWRRAQEKISPNLRPRANKNMSVLNPLAGILVCGLCGKTMIRRPMPKTHAAVLCTNTHCKNIGSYLHYVEEDAIRALDDWLRDYKLDIQNSSGESSEVQQTERAIQRAESEIAVIDGQVDKLRDFLEKGIYPIDVYMERFQKLESRKAEETKRLKNLKKQLSTFSSAHAKAIIPKMEYVLETYYSLQSPEQRNRLLKTAVKSIKYIKTEKGGKTEESQRNYALKIQPLFFVGDD